MGKRKGWPTMQPADFASAAASLAAGEPQAVVAGFPGVFDAAHVPWLRLAGHCARVFLARPPLAPGAVICGATWRDGPNAPAHVAGIGPDARSAFLRAMSEVAEARALCCMAPDPRLDPAGRLPLLALDLTSAGTIDAALVLRPPGAGPVGGLAAGADIASVARAAWQEAVERHAIALWAAGDASARPLATPGGVMRFESALRRGVAHPPLQFIRLPGAVPGLHVVAALSRHAGGILPGYGCAADPAHAACKAACEAVLAEFAVLLETRARDDEGIPPPPGGFVRRGQWLAGREDLTAPAPGPLATGPVVQPVLAVLGRPEDGLAVLRAVAPTLRVPPVPGPV